MPENDVLRFVIVLFLVVLAMALLFKIFDEIASGRKHRRRIERVKLQLDWADKIEESLTWQQWAEAMNETPYADIKENENEPEDHSKGD